MSNTVVSFYVRDLKAVWKWLETRQSAVVRQQARGIHDGKAWEATIVLDDADTATDFKAWLEARDDVSFASPFDLFDRRRD